MVYLSIRAILHVITTGRFFPRAKVVNRIPSYITRIGLTRSFEPRINTEDAVTVALLQTFLRVKCTFTCKLNHSQGLNLRFENRKTGLSPQYFITDRSKAVLLLWFIVYL